MTDEPNGTTPPGPDGPADPWDAWRRWSPARSSGVEGPSDPAWDAWKSWSWSPRARSRPAAQLGCLANLVRIGVVALVLLVVASIFIGATAEPEDLAADELIAAIDALPETGPRDQRPPDTAAGETATFPAPGLAPPAMAVAITSARAPTTQEVSGEQVFLLYEEATVVVRPAGAGPGSEVIVFDDNRQATRRYPLLIGVPGWTGALDDFDARARSRGGIGGFRGGGGGFGK